MKYLILALLFTLNLWAGEAMITVLEAPIFRQESQDSKIVQYARKGQIIYIDERDLKPEMDENFSYKESGISIPPSTKKIFYKTLDKNGRDAFILGEHVKIIYKDFREFREKLTDLDPTDYRIAEPISDKFPFVKTNTKVINLFFGTGPQRKISYPYSENIIYEEYQLRTAVGFNFFWPKNDSQSFRWGINGAFFNGNSRFMLENETKTYEQLGQFSLGPQMQFMALNGPRFEISYVLGLNVDWTRDMITQQLTNGTEGERVFQGLSAVPQASIYLTGVELLWSVDLIFMIEAQLILPQTLKPDDSSPNNGSWNSSNQDYISIPFGGQVNFFLGFSSKI
jgi:hypothetical protein